MITFRKGRRFLVTVAKGKTTNLQGDKSDVKLEIREGCPERAYLMEVRTDPSSFESIIPDDECFISPIVEVLIPAETSTSSYILRIPTCPQEEDDRAKVKVRMVHENRISAVVEVPPKEKCTDGVLFYDIDSSFIELHTKHFCLVICIICQNPYHCRGRINSFWFARFDTQAPEQSLSFKHDVEIRPYFSGVLHATADFRKVTQSTFHKIFFVYAFLIKLSIIIIKCCSNIDPNHNLTFHYSSIIFIRNKFLFHLKQSVEETVNLRCVTQGCLKKSKSSFNPEYGQIKFSVKVADPVWEPKQGLDKWDLYSRTFTEVSFSSKPSLLNNDYTIIHIDMKCFIIKDVRIIFWLNFHCVHFPLLDRHLSFLWIIRICRFIKM